MPSLTLILTLFLAADLAINEVFAELDIQNILQALQLQLEQQQQNEQLEQVKSRYQYQQQSDKDDNDSRYGSLRPQEVQTLIQEALQDRDEASAQSQKEPYVYKKKRQQSNYNDQAADDVNVYALWQGINGEQENQHSENKAIAMLLSQQNTQRKKKNNSLKKYQDSYLDHLNHLLSLALDENNKQQRYESHQKQSDRQRLRPNDLLGDFSNSNTAYKGDADLNNYSKVYLILNVDSVDKSQNQNRLTDLVSSLLNSASSSRGAKEDQRYKGFRVHHGSRKANVDVETDLDYKPKRSRAHDGGRTPIPYIRHRGDIYEKES